MSVNAMELRDLQYFAVVAEHGNVRRASEILELSPPALSKSLRRLEQSLKAKLVTRSAKGVELTAVGSALLAQIGRIRLTLDDVAREAEDLSQGRAGHLRIGVNAVTLEDLSAANATLMRDAPNVTLAVTVSDNAVMVPALQNGELDLVVNYLTETPYAGCATEYLCHDDVVVYASASHPLASLRSVTMAQIARERWALSPVQKLSWHWFYRAFQDRGLPPPTVAVETRSLQLRINTVATSRLLGFNSRRTIRRADPRFRLKELPMRDVTWRRPIGVIYRDRGYLSPAARRFIEILKAVVKESAGKYARVIG